jgi:predicted O-methyltransferase YrrM
MSSPTGLWRHIIRANDQRLSRLHDRKGNLTPLSRIFTHVPRAVSSYLLLRLLGKRPVLPWISYSAIEVIEQKLAEKPSLVLEFGSGMSTVWFASHAKRVSSIEHDAAWFNIVNERINNDALLRTKVEYRSATDREPYTTYKAHSGERFDVILFDGPWRAECIKYHAHLIKPGGLLYLDNSDAESSSGEPGEIQRAEQWLIGFANKHNATIEYFTDFVPTMLFASEGMLVRMPEE